MSKRAAEFFVIDALLAIDRLTRYGNRLLCPDDLLINEMLSSAILYEFSVLGEAMNHILHVKKFEAFVLPSWRIVVDFRNIVIHEYFGLDLVEVMTIIKSDLPQLEKQIMAFIKSIPTSEHLLLAVKLLKKELEQRGRKESLVYLQGIESALNHKK
ncbi:DUF86 domain-containing protein [Candidatus Dependentiae bacterium]|nr:DUF86 domain-containing protein [Candidatus Dependentiae bacterium]